MTKLLSTLVALLAITGPASAAPQAGGVAAPLCDDVPEFASGVRHEGPYDGAPETVGGISCISSSKKKGGETCAHSKTYTHSVGTTYTVGGGLSGLVTLKEIFLIGGDVSVSKS